MVLEAEPGTPLPEDRFDVYEVTKGDVPLPGAPETAVSRLTSRRRTCRP